MRGPILAVCLAAAVVVWHATQQPSADRDLAAATPPLDIAEAPTAIAPPLEMVSLPWGAHTAPISTAASFVYAKNHPATPLPALALAAMTNADASTADDGSRFSEPIEMPFDADAGRLQMLSRTGLCSAIVSVARANDLPIPFFANLIWQESSFQSKTISSAGALGIAQFIPETAIEHGLMNPFEPVHALFASGKLLRKLTDKFGNLGLAAAAYNAGPQRVYDWLAERRTLPGETRDYVMRITGRPATLWTSSAFLRAPEATLMPARAPCAEVAEAVKSQAKIVRVANLMSDLAAATAPAPEAQRRDASAVVAHARPDKRLRVVFDIPLPRKNMRRMQKPQEIAETTPVAPAGLNPLLAWLMQEKPKHRPAQPAAKNAPKPPAVTMAKDASRPPAVTAAQDQKRIAAR